MVARPTAVKTGRKTCAGGVAPARKKRRACARRRRVGGEPSKVVRHRESEIARRAGVLHPSEVWIRAGGGPEEVVVEERRLLVEHVERREVEIEPVLGPRRPVVDIEAELVGPRQAAERARRDRYTAAP